jgi:ABC-type cobalamin/Fe3+-siderophores transport system ATPase subunit
MPVFSHVLVLKDGQVLAVGDKAGTLNSRQLSKAFNAKTKLETSQGRYTLKVR